MPGNTATFANWTGYAQGINGLIYDFDKASRAPVASDFTFKNLGRTGTGAPVVVAPSGFVVQADTPAVGKTRVIVTFTSVGGATPSGAVQDAWLQVDIGTGFGLQAADTHYWGNARFDSGTVDTVNPTNILVNSTDELGARNNPKTSGFNPAPLTWIWDYDKDHLCNATDQLYCRNFPKTGFTCVKVITK